MGGHGSRSMSSGPAYKAYPDGHEITLPWSRSGPVISYGEGWDNGRHVYMTDEQGGTYIDAGTVGDFSIGDVVLYKPPFGQERVVRIKTAHVYPSNAYTFNVALKPDNPNSDSIQVIPNYLVKI